MLIYNWVFNADNEVGLSVSRHQGRVNQQASSTRKENNAEIRPEIMAFLFTERQAICKVQGSAADSANCHQLWGL